MLKKNSAVLVTALNYYELGEKYQRQNQKEKALIFFCKSFKLKSKSYERCDDEDIRRTFSKITQTLTFIKEIQEYIYSKETLSLDRDRFIAYYSSNIGLTAYEKEDHPLAKQRFTEALKIYQRIPGSAENIRLLTEYLEKINIKQQPLLTLRLESFSAVHHTLAYLLEYFKQFTFTSLYGTLPIYEGLLFGPWISRLSLQLRRKKKRMCFLNGYFYGGPKCEIRTENDFKQVIFGYSGKRCKLWKRYKLNFNILNDFMKKCNCKRRPRYLMVERYHNNTHRIKTHLLLLDLLFRTSPDSQSKTSMCQELCYYLFTDHFKDSKCFCTLYSSKSPIEWYRNDSGISRIINTTLRLKNFADIYSLRHLLTDLYQQLDEKNKRQKPDDEDSMVLRVHHSQKMYRYELRSLIKNIGQLIFNNSFLSTTFNQSVAKTYAETTANSTESVAVLLEFEIDTSHTMRPYGHIPESGEEDELIIPPGTIFYLQSVERVNHSPTTCNNLLPDNQKSELWSIQLKSIDEKHFLGETLTILSENKHDRGRPAGRDLLFLGFLKVT